MDSGANDVEITEDDLKMTMCPRCNGQRVVWQPDKSVKANYRQQVRCPDCGGLGLKLTPVGQKLYAFIHEVMRYPHPGSA